MVAITTAYNLLICQFLIEDFHIYAVDIIGHPGKSDEVCLSHRGYDYGKWASEVIDRLGYDKIACFGGSFGGGDITSARLKTITYLAAAFTYKEISFGICSNPEEEVMKLLRIAGIGSWKAQYIAMRTMA